MGVDIVQHRQRIGAFHCRVFTTSRNKIDLNTYFLILFVCTFGIRGIQLFLLLLICCGDVHPNPGPSIIDQSNRNIIHINVRSLKDKIDVINVEFHDYDVICVSEDILLSLNIRKATGPDGIGNRFLRL